MGMSRACPVGRPVVGGAARLIPIVGLVKGATRWRVRSRGHRLHPWSARFCLASTRRLGVVGPGGRPRQAIAEPRHDHERHRHEASEEPLDKNRLHRISPIPQAEARRRNPQPPSPHYGIAGVAKVHGRPEPEGTRTPSWCRTCEWFVGGAGKSFVVPRRTSSLLKRSPIPASPARWKKQSAQRLTLPARGRPCSVSRPRR